MKATVLVDNIAAGQLPGEWGLSILIEYNGNKILLDTGATELFAGNAEGLGVDLTEVDFAVLSHAHYDHSGGFERFLTDNQKAVLFLQEGTKEDCYAKYLFIAKYIGIPKGLMNRFADRIRFTSVKQQIREGIWLLGHSTEGLSAIGKREKMYRKTGLRFLPDDFAHEQSLVLETEHGLVIFNSCCHGGAAAIIREVQNAFPEQKVYGLIGGFHIFKTEEDRIIELAGELRQTGVEYICTGHCSGKRGYKLLHRELGDMVQQLEVGLDIEID